MSKQINDGNETHAVETGVPDWFDPQLLGLLKGKLHRARSGFHWFDRLTFKILDLLFRPTDWGYTRQFTWRDLETMMEEDCAMIRESEFQPDLVVGIKSGGAFISNYIAKLLNVSSVNYVQVDFYSPLLGSTILAFLTRFFRRACLTKESPIDVAGKTVLLVDDQIYTGRSIQAVKEWLTELGAEDIKTYCIYIAGGTTDFGYRKGRMNYVPWGDDP